MLHIDRLHVTTRSLSRKDTNWRTATYASGAVPAIYVGLEAGGVVGVGATSAKSNHASLEQLRDQLEGWVRAELEQASLDHVRRLLRRRDGAIHPRILLAVELALQDLCGKLAGLPAEVLWGGTCRDRVKVIRMIGLKDPDQLPAAMQPLVDEAFTAFKVKIGGGIGQDVERLRVIRSAFGPKVAVMVDANGVYTADEAIDLCRRLAEHDVALVEQPVAYHDIEGLARVTKSSPVDVVADQCVYDVASAADVCQRQAADAISIKITKMGTIEECVRVIAVCDAFGVGVHLGGSAAPGLVDSAACRLALTQASILPACEVGESGGLEGDVGGGFAVVDGHMTSDGSPGLGGPAELFADAS